MILCHKQTGFEVFYTPCIIFSKGRNYITYFRNLNSLSYNKFRYTKNFFKKLSSLEGHFPFFADITENHIFYIKINREI